MDGEKFDDLIKRFCTTRLTRMSALRGLVAGAAAALIGSSLALDETEAQKKKKGGGKKRGGAKKVGPVKKKGGAKKKGGGKKKAAANTRGSSRVRAQASVEPTEISGNPTCPSDVTGNRTNLAPDSSPVEFCEGEGEDQCCCTISWTLRPAEDTDTHDQNSILDFSSDCNIKVVNVKAGPDGANQYDYRPDGTSGDTGLTAPLNPSSGKFPAISHIDFCGITCQPACVPAECPTPPQCQQAICNDDDECENVDDSSQDGTTCDYDGTVPDCQEAVCSSGDCVLQTDPDQEGDPCDDAGTPPQCQKSICGSGEDAGTCVFVADAEQDGDSCSLANPVICVHGICEEGVCEPENDLPDTPCGTNGQDICCIPVGSTTVVCVDDSCGGNVCKTFDEDTCRCVGDGCTLTQGFWKTHPEDWAGTGHSPNDPFFNSGTTWLGALQQSSNLGNGYYALAQQYIAAVLNVASGACAPQAVLTAISQAAALFQGTTNTFNKNQKTTVTNLISILDRYNNGVTGPGHCDD